MTIKQQVLKLRKNGITYRRIALMLGIGKTTAEYHCNSAKYQERQNIARRLKKVKLVAAYGGKCYKCGYNKCNSALDFHHEKPSNKTISIANAIRLGWNMPKLKEEASKCVLLCSNCHHELHETINV